MKTLVLLLVFVSGYLAAPRAVEAKYDPLQVPNNRFGIHILTENDIADAASLVNSSGGDWGYVTLVIRDDERDVRRWRVFFNQLKQNHLIPIVRIATHLENTGWAIPDSQVVAEWVQFFEQLPWPIENMYIIVYNEPNHAKEWGGHIEPEKYASLLAATANALHAQNDDYFVLPAALDLAAPNGPTTMNAATFLSRMFKEEPAVFNQLDGWTSHSYPNPGFAGSPLASGKMSVRGFEWELHLLRSEFGLTKNLPVFISETGWARSNRLSSNTVAANYRTAFENAWTNPQIVAITPFLLRYDEQPFAPFSFLIPQAHAAYSPQYQAIQELPKTAGFPLGRYSTPLGKLAEKIVSARFKRRQLH